MIKVFLMTFVLGFSAVTFGQSNTDRDWNNKQNTPTTQPSSGGDSDGRGPGGRTYDAKGEDQSTPTAPTTQAQKPENNDPSDTRPTDVNDSRPRRLLYKDVTVDGQKNVVKTTYVYDNGQTVTVDGNGQKASISTPQPDGSVKTLTRSGGVSFTKRFHEVAP